MVVRKNQCIFLIFFFLPSILATTYDVFRTFVPFSEKSSPYQHFFPVVDNTIRFKVKAEQNAHILLTTTTNESTPNFEIIIGAAGNEYTYARKNNVNITESIKQTPFVLLNNSYIGFRIDLEYTTVGKNSKVLNISITKEGRLIPFWKWTEVDPFPIKYFGISSWGAEAFWQIKDLKEMTPRNILQHQKYIRTIDALHRPSYTHAVFPVLKKPIRLKVLPYSYAWIAFLSTPEDKNPSIEIMLGKTSQSIIKNHTMYVVQVNETILEDKGYTEISIDWDYTNDKYNNEHLLKISVTKEGKSSPFMSWEDADLFAINYYAVASSSGGIMDTKCDWILEDVSLATQAEPNPVDEKIITNGKFKFRFFASSSNLLTFKVKAAENAFIVLTTNPVIMDPYIEVILGGWSNRHNFIQKDGTIQAVSSGRSLNKTSFRSFWLQYDYINDVKGRTALLVRVGHGKKNQPFMSWTDTNPYRINYFGIATFPKIKGEWIFTEEKSESARSVLDIKTTSPSDSSYKFYPANTRLATFKVKAARDACISLVKRPTRNSSKIEICLGTANNSKSYILKDGEMKANASGAVLHPDKYQGFWIEWDNLWEQSLKRHFVISVGNEGEDIPFMSWTNPKGFKVDFVGIGSNNAHGDWIISQLNRAGIAKKETLCYVLIFPVTEEKDFFQKKTHLEEEDEKQFSIRKKRRANALSITRSSPLENNTELAPWYSPDSLSSVFDPNSIGPSDYEACLMDPEKQECIAIEPRLGPVHVRFQFNKNKQLCETVLWHFIEECEVLPPNVFYNRESCKSTCLYPRDEYPEMLVPDIFPNLLLV